MHDETLYAIVLRTRNHTALVSGTVDCLQSADKHLRFSPSASGSSVIQALSLWPFQNAHCPKSTVVFLILVELKADPYENTPIQIYRKFYLKILKIFN